MLKKILISLIALALLFSLAACGKDGEPEAILSELQGVEGEAENALPEEEAQPDEEAELEESEPEPEPEPTEEPLPTPDPEPGIPAPAGWPEDIPTPATGEILGGGWAPDRSFYTTDIVYKQADIDAYGRRLESYGFLRQEEHDYGDMWPDATVYSNGQWDVLVAEENDTFEYSYVNFYPLFDAATEGYAGQPEGWPEEGGF